MSTASRLATIALTLLLAACHNGPYQAERVTPQEAHARMAKGQQMLLVDVRNERAYTNEHARGAVNAPFATIRDNPSKKLPKDETLLLYCT